MPSVTLNRSLARRVRALIPASGIPHYESDLREILHRILQAAQITISVEGADIQQIRTGNRSGIHIRPR